ncbi:MAG: hypothetical protein ACTSYD_09230 [Candidatus Heimdallarchaeaceae archaeon]
MGRRVIKKTYKSTYARGQRDTSEFGDRYFVKIELVSIKVLEDKDLVGNESEFYFRVGKYPNYRHRVPQRGTINIEKNETFQITEPLTLYSEFSAHDSGGVIEIPFDMYERDPLKKDDHIINTRITIPLGSSNYQVITEKNVKIKIKISALKTRY